MSKTASQLASIIEKSGRLLDLCVALQEENELLQMENKKLKSSLDAGKIHAAELDEKLKAVKLARSLEGIKFEEVAPNEKTLDIKQKISEFVREIDKCIVLLKK